MPGAVEVTVATVTEPKPATVEEAAVIAPKIAESS
jgi:hypothetical protein